MQTHATYYDGQSSARHAVTLILQSESLLIEGEDFRREYPLDALKLDAPIGQLDRALRLADGGSCQIRNPAFVA
ncbi:MAG: hypothetical protein GWN87_24340, partial [Desulfuromonadales bacterium]|nr:hypothetical protein [Desulfuromonadales bacterium]